jgi:ferredoxin-like protein FixX
MGEVIDLDDHREIWASRVVKCPACLYTWTAVFIYYSKELECPHCRKMIEVVIIDRGPNGKS